MAELAELQSTEAVDGDEAPKKKRKYSKGPLKIAQKTEVRVSKGLNRVARAVEESIGVWRDRRDTSSRKKRDGAVRDALKNYSKALTRFQKVSAKLPEELLGGLPKIKLFG